MPLSRLSEKIAAARRPLKAGVVPILFLSALYLVICDQHALMRALAREGAGPGLEALGGILLFLLYGAVLSLFALPRLFRPTLTLLLFVAAVCGYFMDSYGVVINRSMLVNVFATDSREAAELLTWPLFRHLLVHAFLPLALLYSVRIVYRPLSRQLAVNAALIFFCLTAAGGLILINFKELSLFGREHRQLRMLVNPSYPLYSLAGFVSAGPARVKKDLQPVAADALRKPGGRAALILVIGETARAQNFSLNGYSRPTNPLLTRKPVVTFSEVSSCGTATAESLPCLFSNLGRASFSIAKAGERENLLDVLQKTGIRVVWRDNNSGSKGVADRVEYEDLAKSADPLLCSGDNCYDEILLQGLESRLAANTGQEVIVLHQKGSHGPAYYKRVPARDKVFEPECTRDEVQECSTETIVNAYDNTIVYTDRILANLIDLLAAQNYPAALLYVSDHGESLGENNLYLHGFPYAFAPPEQTRVPMLFWGSDSFYQEKNLDRDCLQAEAGGTYSHDNIFHSLLGLFDIRSRDYDPQRDLFAPCRPAKGD